jgi:hypothetical protein
MSLKVIVTGATGMVGEGVLLDCLDNPAISEVLVVGRRATGRSHAKLKEVLAEDFFNLGPIEARLGGYDACFFCLGVSSVGMKKEDYHRVTYDLTMNFATVLARLNPELVFCYITGAGTDGSEKGRIHWARVKGATENALLRLFPRAYMFRPGFMKPTPGQQRVNKYYKYIAWMYPVGRKLFPGKFCTIREVGLAMIGAASGGAPKSILEVKDIVALAADRGAGR